MLKDKFKQWKKTEMEEFCEDNWMEQKDIDRLWAFIKDYPRVSLQMLPGRTALDGNDEGILVLKICGTNE